MCLKKLYPCGEGEGGVQTVRLGRVGVRVVVVVVVGVLGVLEKHMEKRKRNTTQDRHSRENQPGRPWGKGQRQEVFGMPSQPHGEGRTEIGEGR